MKNLVALTAFIASLTIPAISHADDICSADNAHLMDNKTKAPWDIKILFDPNDVPLNNAFNAKLAICTDKELFPSHVTVDATMPAHKHGMNYEVTAAKLKDYQYEVRNLLFHMAGSWQIEVIAFRNGEIHQFTHTVKVR